MAKGFIELDFLATDENTILRINIRPELISMYRADGANTLIWLDPQQNPLICIMALDDFEREIMVNELY